MSQTEICRLCAKLAKPTNSKNLFEPAQRKLLIQIEELVGMKFRDTKSLPQQICKFCQVQTQQAHKFCRRCVQAQEYFASSEHQGQIEEKLIPKTAHVDLENEEPTLKVENENDEAELIDVCFDSATEEQNKEKEDDENEAHEYTNDQLMPTFDIEEVLLKDDLSTNSQTDEEFCNEEEDEDSMDMEYNELSLDTDEGFKIVKLEVKPRETHELSTNLENEAKSCAESSTFSDANDDEDEDDDNEGNPEHYCTCQICDTRCATKSHLAKHMLQHSNERRFVCDLCEKRFRTSWDLKRHFNTHTGEKTYPCKYCEKRFNYTGSLSRHLRDEHSNETPVEYKTYICEQCGRHFKDSGNFYTHMRRHAGDRRHHCKLCPKKFYLATELQNHVRTHTGEKPFRCKYCERRFTSRHRAVRHERSIHLVGSEDETDCNLCMKSFQSVDALREHIKTHSDVRNFKCELCNVSFKINKHLMQHRRSKQHKKQEILSNATTRLK